MCQTKAHFFFYFIILLLLNIVSVETSKLTKKEIDIIKKGIFLDSYAISMNQLFSNKTIFEEKNLQKKRKLEDLMTLKEVGFFPYDLDTQSKSFIGYRNIFENIGQDRSKFILYPYGFKYKKKNKEGILEEKEQNKGGFFSLDSKIIPSSIKNIKNITSAEISKSKALYDVDIGILTYETIHEKIKKDLFIEADSYCTFFSNTLAKVKTCSMNLKDFQANKVRYFNKGGLLMISPEILKDDKFDLNSFGFLIIPDYIIKTEDIILNAWEKKGIDKIINFHKNGGNILATGKSGFLLEKLGLIMEGSYITDKNLYYKEDYGLVSISGCDDIINKTPSEQSDFYKQVICMNFVNKMYITSIFTMNKDLIEEKKELNVIMNLNPEYINDNLIYNLDNGEDENIGDDDYFPLVLTKEENDKEGRITIVNGNLFVNTENTFHLILNPLFYSMGKNIIFDAYIKYESNTQEDIPIPGGEQGIRLNCYFKFINLIDINIKDITVDIFIAQKTEFTELPSGCIKVTNDKTKYINFTDMEMSTYLQCSINELEKFSEFSKDITIEITDQSVTQKLTSIPIFYPLLSYKESDSTDDEKKYIDYGPVTVTASLSAILRVTANSEPPGDYPLYAWGLYLDQVFEVENKENTEAKNINLISVIPIVSVLVNDIKENSVVHTVELYDQYYKDHDYSYPWTKTAEEYDYIDYAELSDKDIIIDKDYEQPVKHFKVERVDIKDENKNIFKVEDNISLDIEENSLIKTNNQILLKQVCFQDADIFYEVADFRRFPFIDTSKTNGAKTYYKNSIPPEEQDPEDTTRAKIEVPFSRIDFYFMSDPNYQTPENVTDDMILTIDKYPDPVIKTDKEIKKYMANISKVGNFDSTKENGKIIPDEYYNVLKQHNQIKKYINPLEEGYNITNDFPDFKVSHYLISIPGNRIKRAGSIKGFIEEENSFGYLEEYPQVKFIYAHTITFMLGKKLTRLGGKLVVNLGTNEFKDNKLPSENEFVTLSVDGVAVYKIDYEYEKGVKNIITAYFKRGLMPDEIAGKDSNVQLNIENLTSTSSITINMELYELKYDLSKPDTNFEVFQKVEEFETERILTYNKFWSLPCLIIQNKFTRKPSNNIKEYELLSPYARYTVYAQELLKHRSVFCSSLSNHVTNPGLQTPFSSYGLITNIGIVSIPFADYVNHPTLIIPAASSTSRIEWDDIWGRKWAQPIRSLFPDFLPLPYVSQNFMMTTTYEIIQNGTRELEWNSRDEADILIHIKFLNNYFKYVNLAICKNNQIIEGVNENEFINITNSHVYGYCYQDNKAFLSGKRITGDLINNMDKAMLCADNKNTLEMLKCTEEIKALDMPLLVSRDSKVQLKEDEKWNYSPLVENYYPKGYIDEEIMWDMTKLNYASDVYYKGYPWHFDNTLPGFDKLYFEKPDNLMAFPIFKGFGYKMEYDKDNSVKDRYNNMKGWWSDNLQNKDNTLLAGQDHSNKYSTIDEELLTEDSWINAKKINSDIVIKKLKNIYICQFNQHRIKVDPQTNTQHITFSNIFQNNIIPIYPELDDSEYESHDCTDEYQYSPQNISLVDNRVKTNTDRDWLYFAANLRAEAKETLNIILKLKPFEDRQFEGLTKVNDGGRFTYWNPSLTRNGYIYLDNNVNIVESYRTDITCTVRVFPYTINTYKTTNYHLFTFEDKNEYHREYNLKTYTNSYGFGDSVVTIYVGGTEDTDCRIKPGESTYIKITFYNNAGFDWNMKAGAITDIESKYKFNNKNDLMKKKVHAIQVPKEYNFLELIIPEPLKDYIDIKPSDHNKDVLPQFFDFQSINVVSIRDGYIGEYFYKMTLKPGLDEKYFGRLWEIKINLKSEYFDLLPGLDNDPYLKVNQDKITLRHDYQLKIPSIKFGIPYPSNHEIAEYRNKVFYTIGRAHDLRISYNHLEEFDLEDIKIVSDSEIEKMQKASSNEQNYNEELLNIWNNEIANKSSLLTGDIIIDKLQPSDGYRRVWIYLNKSFPEFPYEKYGEPDINKINLLMKLSASQTSDGKKLGIKWGYGTFNDSKLIRKTNVDNAAYIVAKGPWILVDIEETLLKYDKNINNFTNALNQTHYASSGYMKLKITAKNSGSNIAYQTSYKYVFSTYAEILNFGDVLKKKDIISLKRGNNGETEIYINSNRQIPISIKDAYNIYIKYDFNEDMLRNLEENNNKEKIILKSGDISLCQNTICNSDESLVNQHINIDYKMSLDKVVSIEHLESIPELEIKLDEDNNNNENKPKSKAWIAAIVVALIIILICIYLIIDYKKKIFIFKKKSEYLNTEEKLENNNNDINNVEKIEVSSITKKRRRRISNVASVDMRISN